MRGDSGGSSGQVGGFCFHFGGLTGHFGGGFPAMSGVLGPSWEPFAPSLDARGLVALGVWAAFLGYFGWLGEPLGGS